MREIRERERDMIEIRNIGERGILERERHT